MADATSTPSLEQQIDQWRSYLRRRQAIHTVDVTELEDHLREQVADLVAAGLSVDEAFLVAVKRIGAIDALSREFAREHSDRLWKQLVIVAPDETDAESGRARRDATVAFALATIAGLAVLLPRLLGFPIDNHETLYLRNASLFVLPSLVAYFVWKRHLPSATTRWLAVALAVALIIENSYPFVTRGSTELLSAIHLPLALWLVVGIAYAGGRWSETAGRMDFVRFSGELFIYFVLIALGGGVLTAFMAMIFQAIGIRIEPVLQFLIPSCAAGGFLIAAWLVESKQSVIENMAPVLTRLFTPLFAIALLAFLGTLLVTGHGISTDRNVLIAFDALLALVVALLLYSLSARDPRARPSTFDVVQVTLVISALVVDAVALWAIATRIGEFGFTPNRIAALGGNILLLVNLAWSAVLYLRFLRQRGTFAALERWQTNYLPAYSAWAAIVVITFPLLFRFS